MKNTAFVSKALVAVALGAVVVTVAVKQIPRAEAMIPLAALEPATPEEIATTLHRCGLDPEGLATAGVQPAAVEAIVLNLRDQLVSDMQQLRELDVLQGRAAARVNQLRRQVQSGRASEEDVSALPQARIDHNNAQLGTTMFIGAAFQNACGDMSEDLLARLSIILENHDQKLPLQYLVTDRSDHDWKALREALAVERTALERGLEVDPRAVEILEAVRSEPDVMIATVNLETLLPAIESIWDGAVDEI